MSWETFEYDISTECACGNGKVIRHIISRSDDWGRSEKYYTGEKIECPECVNKYYIRHIIRYRSCPSWERSGKSDRAFLVPNEINMPDVIEEKVFFFQRIDEEIVSRLSLDDINASINDMINNKYSTRVKLESSRLIINEFQWRYKRRSLNIIIPFLEELYQNYNNYEWTFERVEKYKEKEKTIIAENEKTINEAIPKSFELHFRLP